MIPIPSRSTCGPWRSCLARILGEFYIAAVINSARVTLVSIVLCTLLGIIIGVTRLSSNRLASSLATIYVGVFRNLPLAVLLFLVWTQMGRPCLIRRRGQHTRLGVLQQQGFLDPAGRVLEVYAFLATFMLLWVFTRIKQIIDMRRQDSAVDDSDRAVLMRSGKQGAIIVIGTLFVLEHHLPRSSNSGPIARHMASGGRYCI